METEIELYDIGIIGAGPRGLSALEALFQVGSRSDTFLKVIMVEPCENPGAGPVYNLDQPDTNWLNVAKRALAIPSRKAAKFQNFEIPAFGTFQEWSGFSSRDVSDTEKDEFPLRSELGKYLNERFHSIADILIAENGLTLIKGEAEKLEWVDGTIRFTIAGGKRYTVREAALCIGHQPIEPDEQLDDWKTEIQENDDRKLFDGPYPLHDILKVPVLKDESVAIRGFGLAMIDVVRGLTTGLGGEFKILDEFTRRMKFVPKGSEPKTIIPFSLNGQPMAPKPLNKAVDQWYVPTEEQIEAYKDSVSKSISTPDTLKSPVFLIEAIVPIITRTFMDLGPRAIEHHFEENEISKVAKSWLQDEEFEHSLLISQELTTKETMKAFVDMASGTGPVTLDFCIGHVWRHCQPTMYGLLSFAPLSDDLIGDIVALDERLKRYSYGPPIESLQQLLALSNHGILNLDFIQDPDIDLSDTGWEFRSNGRETTVKVMVNSVLDAPQLLKVTSPAPRDLIRNSSVKLVHDKLGVRTNKEALMFDEATDAMVPMAMMGRLAKGTLIGVDAIAECFGERSELWAKGAIKRFGQNENQV